MATLVATVGSASANSLCTRAEAVALADEIFPRAEVQDFLGLGGADQDRCLIQAQKVLEGFRWKGERTDSIQALELPREGLPLPDGSDVYDNDEIPAAAKAAQARLAFWLAKTVAAGGSVGPSEVAGLTSISFGAELSMAFEAGAASVSAADRYVSNVIRPLLAGLVYAPGARVVRG